MEVLKPFKTESINCCVTSPPYYGLRDYGVDGQIGLEETPEQYIQKMVEVFREVKRVLRDDGTLWVNIGDSYLGTGGNRKCESSNKTFNDIQKHNPRDGRYERNKAMKTNGIKAKDLIGIPWMLAFALRADGWYLRQDIIWHKPNPMPESVKDRCTKSHEYIFLLSKSRKYYFDYEAIMEPCVSDKGNNKSFRGGGAYTNNQSFDNSSPAERKTHGNKPNTRYGGKKYTKNPDIFFRTKSGNLYESKPLRNKRNVWTVSTKGYKGAHYATFPPDLIEPCILAGCPEGGTVLDPFGGSGTVGVVAKKHNRDYVLIDISPDYCELSRDRIAKI